MSATKTETTATVTTAKTPLVAADEWIDRVDLEAFQKDVRALGDRLASEEGEDDIKHLSKMLLWSNSCTAVGLVTAPLLPLWSLLPAVLLSLGTTSRWTMIAHHTCHGGYDKTAANDPNYGTRWNRFKFGLGSLWRRTLDWMDWMLPEAWNVEHNQLHHYKLGEEKDPDLVERNMSSIRDMDMPMIVKDMAVVIIICTWKWWYYAPNTFKHLRAVETRKKDKKLYDEILASKVLDESMVFNNLLWGSAQEVMPFITLFDFMMRVAGPYIIYRFFLLPMVPALAVSVFGADLWATYISCIAQFLLADLFANIHSFVIIATNHCGDDLYRFTKPCRFNSGTFYLRQVVSSANFSAGTDTVDFFHGWLNYQVEHHLWPSLSMLSYQKSMPEVKKLAAKHGIPYVQENVLLRLWKTVEIMTGRKSMRRFPVDREVE